MGGIACRWYNPHMNAQPLSDHQDAFEHHANTLSNIIPLWQTALERAEAQRRDALLALGNAIRQLDQLLSDIAASRTANTQEGAALMARVRQARDDAFAAMQTHVPNEAYYWTPEWQAGEREVDAALAEGRTTFFPDDESFEAALRARRAHV